MSPLLQCLRQTGYGIASVEGCGGTLSGDTYTTGPITADCSVNVSFTATGCNPMLTPRAAQCSGATAVKNLTYQMAVAFIRSAEYTNRNRNNGRYVEDLFNGIFEEGTDLRDTMAG